MVIRSVKPSDASAILSIYSYYVLNSAVTFELAVPTKKEMEDRIALFSASFPYLVAEEDGHVEGYCYAHALNPREAYRKSVELSIYVDKDAHGRGIGTRLYSELEKELKERGFSALYAIVTTPDCGSVAFHRKAGFKIVGKLTDCGEKFNRKWSVVYMEKHI